MSNRYKGGIISATPPTTSKASASGAWTLEQQMQAQGAGTWPYAGPTYIEDVFSTWLYTGNGATQTITNGVDLSSYGGLVWTKCRSGVNGNWLWDTARGVDQGFQSNSINASSSLPGEGLTAFNANGFTLGNNVNWNQSGSTFSSWTFRKQPKFFDIVTFTTGAGTNLVIPHSLGSVPGCVIIKNTQQADNFYMYHRGLTSIDYKIYLNTTAGENTGGAGTGAITAISSTTFTIRGAGLANNNTHIAYVFAHDAGGFGLTGTDNVISCGSVTNTSQQVTLGYEPQWIMYKTSGTAGNWNIFDNMRGMTADGSGAYLSANLTNAEATASGQPAPNATGFYWTAGAGSTCIYIAIRRGPMKVPTSGTSVFSPITSSAATGTNQTTGFPVDMQIKAARATLLTKTVADRLRGVGTTPTSDIGLRLSTNLTSAETASSAGGASKNWTNTGFANPSDTGGISAIYWNWGRAPSFMDVVCYTGTGGGANAFLDVSHNLGVTPEMIIVKQRNAVNATAPYDWPVYHKDITTAGAGAAWLVGSAAKTTDYVWRRGASGQKVDASTFSLNGNYLMSNASGGTYVAYLFATCAGVSKVGSYTGTGATQTIDCGFTGGARFVLIKRTDSSGHNWIVWDTARGMVAGTDPQISLNTTAAESNANWIYTATGGFQIVTTDASVNASGGTYIFLAIA